MASATLLTRDAFREAVFARDDQTCVACPYPAQDAHHVLERRLFPDGGYYLANGVSLCGPCHIKAEQTLPEWDCDHLRLYAGITEVVLPPHLYPDERYDKWGNVILPNGRRLKGELFDDESVQKALAPVLHLFDNRVKYPRTWHLPWSPGATSDDRMLTEDQVARWIGTEVVITEKMDGENTTMYRDYLHARSVEYSGHVSRNYVKQLHASICADIPDGHRLCGENVWAKHSIAYADLPDFFLLFSVWNGTQCLSWADTVEWAALLGLHLVPVIYQGPWTSQLVIPDPIVRGEGHEGYVVRPSSSFTLREFPARVGKYVRKDHVQTHGHWMRSVFTPNTRSLVMNSHDR